MFKGQKDCNSLFNTEEANMLLENFFDFQEEDNFMDIDYEMPGYYPQNNDLILNLGPLNGNDRYIFEIINNIRSLHYRHSYEQVILYLNEVCPNFLSTHFLLYATLLKFSFFSLLRHELYLEANNFFEKSLYPTIESCEILAGKIQKYKIILDNHLRINAESLTALLEKHFESYILYFEKKLVSFGKNTMYICNDLFMEDFFPLEDDVLKCLEETLTIPQNTSMMECVTPSVDTYTEVKHCFAIKKVIKNPKILTKKLHKGKALIRYNPGFTKRENIDKKIIRKFRKYLLINYKRNPSCLPEDIFGFWDDFVKLNMLPPMSYKDLFLNELKEFKSFNTKYIIWLFSQTGAKELYADFISNQGSKLVESIANKYNIKFHKLEDLAQIKALREYLQAFADLYTYPEEIKKNNCFPVADSSVSIKDQQFDFQENNFSSLNLQKERNIQRKTKQTQDLNEIFNSGFGEINVDMDFFGLNDE